MEKLRTEISDEFKWDVDSLIEDYEVLEKKIFDLLDKVLSYKGKIMDSSNSLLNFYKDSENLDRALDYLYKCSRMLYDSDTTNANYQGIKMKAEKIYDDISNQTSFIIPEMLKADYDLVLKYIKENKGLEYYRFDLERIFRDREHTLSEKEEAIISKALNVFGIGEDVFENIDNTDIDLGTINVDGKDVVLTHSNYIKYMNSSNRETRIKAFNAMYAYYKKFINTIAACLKGNIKENFFISEVRNFKSPLEESLWHDNIDVLVYKKLIEVTHKNLDKLHKYMAIRKEVLGLSEMNMYDIYVDLVKVDNIEIPFSKGKEMVLEALKPLGEEYINDLKKAFSEHWIDIYPSKGKKSGAYSWGSFDTKPYLLLNYSDNLDSVNTLVHELGHSMHTYYSKSQGYTYHSYSIFLAEIASTVNEVLLNNYLYEHAKSKEEKILYVTEMLDKIRATIYRQTQFAEFEMIVHEKEAKGIPLTASEFNNTYYELNKKYYGNNVVSDDLIKYEWARIPHFYSSFYVYKYATGLTSALAIAHEILNGNEEARNKYLEFLHSGCKDYPLNILKNTGVDITDSKVIQKAFDYFDEQLEKLKKLI